VDSIEELLMKKYTTRVVDVKPKQLAEQSGASAAVTERSRYFPRA
jgi:hypothetical protein